MKIRNGYKKIHLDTGIWQYKIGSMCAIFYSPEGKKFIVRLTTYTGLTWSQLEHERSYFAPSTARDYIENNLVTKEKRK